MFPLKVTAKISASLLVISAEHSQVPRNSRATTTGISAIAIDGIVLGLTVGLTDGGLDGGLDGKKEGG